MWKVLETKQASKRILRLPKNIALIYRQLVFDLELEGPHPKGWESKPLKNRSEISIRLNREYRVLLEIVEPHLIVMTVAHRKDVYK